MFEHTITDLQLAEFDLGGVLYHANYYRLYERAREALLREGGIPYSQLVADGNHLAVVEAHQTFKAPVRYGQPLCIRMWITDLKNSVATFNYEITSADAPDRPLHTGWTKQVFVTIGDNGFRPSRFIGKLLTVLQNHLVN
ncbi:MAG: thioesterase family protein [Bdellovibrionota bacterium]